MLFEYFTGLILIYLAVRTALLLVQKLKCRSRFNGALAQHLLWCSQKPEQVKTMVVCGSGGHTAEMMKLIPGLCESFSPLVYIIADSDTFSKSKVLACEREGPVMIEPVFRARHVGQSYLSSIPTTLYSIFLSLWIVLKHKPDLVLCNGPGTCVPIAFSAFLLQVLVCYDIRIVFVESICRVTHLSLSAKFLYPVADLMFVQWPKLADKYSYVSYIGKLV